MSSLATITEITKIHTGESNAKEDHLVVPLRMPLAPALTFDQALRHVQQSLRIRARRGQATLIAVAQGTMVLGDHVKKVRLVLFRDSDGYGYQTVESNENKYEMAVLLDGDGRRYLRPEPLPREEALARWMAGFLHLNCEVPGLYRLRYALVEPAGTERRPN
jgi:hypothetical protein